MYILTPSTHCFFADNRGNAVVQPSCIKNMCTPSQPPTLSEKSYCYMLFSRTLQRLTHIALRVSAVTPFATYPHFLHPLPSLLHKYGLQDGLHKLQFLFPIKNRPGAFSRGQPISTSRFLVGFVLAHRSTAAHASNDSKPTQSPPL